MAQTPSSTKSESVTLRIPNEVFSQVLSYATDNTKGNRSEAIVELIEMGLAVARSQQPTQPGRTVQDNVFLGELSQTVTGLVEQVEQLTGAVQDNIFSDSSFFALSSSIALGNHRIFIGINHSWLLSVDSIHCLAEESFRRRGIPRALSAKSQEQRRSNFCPPSVCWGVRGVGVSA